MRGWPIRDNELEALFGELLGQPFALAVSGGPDSMALMHLVARWLRQGGDTSGARIGGKPTVLTVDHGLRPEAAAEAAFVAAEADKLGLAHRTLTWHPPRHYRVVQAEARDARYRLLARELSTMTHAGVAAPRLVTAHHADDQAETVLMRLGRGSGLDGLLGMRPVKTLCFDGGDGRSLALTVVRPLLGVASIRLRDTLTEAGLSWCEDPSNSDDNFERVRLRRVRAALSEIGIDTTALVRSASRLARSRAAYISLLEQGPARSIVWHEGLLGEVDLAPWPEDVRQRLLRALLSVMSGAAKPARLLQAEALVARMRLGAVDETLGGCRVVSDQTSRLRIWRETGRGLPTLELEPGEAKSWDGGRFTVAMATQAEPQGQLEAPVTVSALGAADWAILKRALPGLADLRLPAGAVAGLPAFRRDGQLLAVPTLERIVATREKPGSGLARSLRRQLGPEVVPFSADFTGASRPDMPVSFRCET